MFSEETTNVLYLPLAEGTKKLHDLRKELDGALMAQRRAIRALWLCFGVLAIVSVCAISFCLGTFAK